MWYTKIHSQSFLGSGEEDFKCIFFTLYGHGGHLVQWCGIFRTNYQYTFDRIAHVKSG